MEMIKAVASNDRNTMKLTAVKHRVSTGTESDVTGVLSLTNGIKKNMPSNTDMTREIRSPDSTGKRKEMAERRERRTHGTTILMM